MNTARKRWFWLLAILCAGALAVSLFWMTKPLFLKEKGDAQAGQPAPYLLRDSGGRIALYRQGEEEPVQVYDLYTHLLPQTDVLSLQKGIPIENEEQLDRLLEDLGL